VQAFTPALLERPPATLIFVFTEIFPSGDVTVTWMLWVAPSLVTFELALLDAWLNRGVSVVDNTFDMVQQCNDW
jgi:hypothetical protein